MSQKFTNQRNPILPLNYHVPDSEAHVMSDGNLYLYGSYDERNDLYCSEKHYVVKTSDMKNWEISDVAVRGSSIPWNQNDEYPRYPGIDWEHPTPFIAKMLADMKEKQNSEEDLKAQFEKEQGPKPKLLFAPDCIEKDNRYYMYICGADDREGVVSSDSPFGPFENPVQLPCGGIDPAIFIDDDGKIYYYWGQLFSHGVELNDDMQSFKGEVQDDLVTETEHYFHEGSSMRKIGDTYYYIYADMQTGTPTSLGYSIGKKPFGPFTYGGIIINNRTCDPQSWNNHGSIECFQGQYYIFYHRSSRNSEKYRRLCVEPIAINPDGTIPEVVMTSQGVGDPYKLHEPLFAYQACEVHGGCWIDINGGISPEAAGLQADYDDPQMVRKAVQADMSLTYPEKLTGIVKGSSAIWRYIRTEKGAKKIQLKTAGTGKVQVWVRRHEPGVMAKKEVERYPYICCGEICVDSDIVIGNVEIPSGEWELKLEFIESDQMEIFELQLF